MWTKGKENRIVFDWFLILLAFAFLLLLLLWWLWLFYLHLHPSPAPVYLSLYKYKRTHMHARRHIHTHPTQYKRSIFTRKHLFTISLSKSTRNSHRAMHNIYLKTIIPSMETNIYECMDTLFCVPVRLTVRTYLEQRTQQQRKKHEQKQEQ